MSQPQLLQHRCLLSFPSMCKGQSQRPTTPLPLPQEQRSVLVSLTLPTSFAPSSRSSRVLKSHSLHSLFAPGRETLRVDLATNRSRVAAFAKAGTAATFAAVEKALHAATRAPTKFTMEELTKLYRYYTPQLGPEGTCRYQATIGCALLHSSWLTCHPHSASTKLEETPFCLATAARLTWSAALAKHPFTARQWRLKQVRTAAASASTQNLPSHARLAHHPFRLSLR